MYKILHIPTGSYYTFMGAIDIPTLVIGMTIVKSLKIIKIVYLK